MEHHPFFDLWLHSREELATLLSTEVIEQATLHEWPLSSVQLLTLPDGQRIIYKVQLRAASVEPKFYSQVRSTLLPWHQVIGSYHGSVSMFFEFLQGNLLKDRLLDEREVLKHASQLIPLIGSIQDHPPVFTDLGDQTKWQEFYTLTLFKLGSVVEAQIFHQVTWQAIDHLRRWASSNQVRGLFTDCAQLAHGDLTWDNVFVTSQGYRVVDWQRPVLGPPGLDQVALWESAGFDPLQYLPAELVQFAWFLRLAWFLDCKTTFFPAGETYDHDVALLVSRILSSSGLTIEGNQL